MLWNAWGERYDSYASLGARASLWDGWLWVQGDGVGSRAPIRWASRREWGIPDNSHEQRLCLQA